MTNEKKDIKNFIQAMNGKEVLAFFRRFMDRTKKDAGKIAFMTEHGISMEKETDTTTTVDGAINSIADGENTMQLSAVASRHEDPEVVAFWEEMQDWFIAKDLVEFWEVDIEKKRINPDNQKEEYRVNYFQGYFTKFELKSESDGTVKLEYEYLINGNGIWRQWDSLTDAQKLEVQATQYTYHTLAKETDIR